MMALYVHLFLNTIFTYDEEEHRREEFAEEKAKVRAKAIKQMQVKYMSQLYDD